MSGQNQFQSFEAQMARIKFIAQAKTQCQLTEVLGIKQASISEASKRGSVPASWLVVLVQKFRANPDWILEGAMPVFLLAGEGGSYDARNLCPSADFLWHIPLDELQKEILRRTGNPQ